MVRASLLGILAGCGHEYALSSIGEALPTKTTEFIDDVGEADPSDPSTIDTPAAAMLSTELLPRDLDLPNPETADDGEPSAIPSDLDLTLGGGASATVADYLFVVDTSSSMQRLLGRVLDGFDALSNEGVFPKDARIAVMSTLAADPEHRDQIHPAVPPEAWLRSEPGFAHLVNGARIAAFRKVAPPRISERFQHEGCDAWFSPSERNIDGVPCLVANTQLALYPVGVEAGMLAVRQKIQAGDPLFRTGATVNVIIVSDTHDPGLPASHPFHAALVAARPTFAEIERSALVRQDLASFRIHAIAPAEVCTAEDWSGTGPVYFDAALTSGGELIDVCDAEPNEYVDLIRRIATNGAIPQRAMIPLSRGLTKDEIAQILVDGEPASFSLSHDGRAVILPDSLLSSSHRVIVRYRRPQAPQDEISEPLAPAQ